MFNEEKKSSLRISSFSFFARFGILCLPPGRVPYLLGIFAFILFKLQTLSICLLFTTKYLEDITYNVVFVAQKISSGFIFGEMFTFNESPLLISLIFAIIQIYTLFLTSLAIFLLVQTYRQKRIIAWFQRAWAYTVYVHMWVLATPIINFNLALLKHVLEGLMTKEIPAATQTIFAAVAVISTVLNVIILAAVIYFTSIPLKFKDPLSMKSKFYMALELSEKLFLYLLYLFLPQSGSKTWIILTLNAIFSCLRVYKIYETLPYFKVAWLKLDTGLTAIISSLSILNIISWMLKGTYQHLPQRFVIIFWFLLTPFVFKSSVAFLDHILFTIFSGMSNQSPSHAMHIVYVIKYFLRRRVKTATNFKSQNPHEILLLGKANVTKLYNEDSDEGSEQVNFDWEVVDHFKAFIDHHFHKITDKFPKSIPLRIMKIWSRFKYQKSYLEVANMIIHMKQDPLISVNTEISLLNIRLRLEEEMKIRADQISIQNSLDMKRFILMQDDSDKILAKMVKQAELQKRFWIVYTGQKFEFQTLYQISENIRKMKEEINNDWKSLESFNNKKYITPYLIYGMYLENLNNNPSLSDIFIRQNVWALIKISNHVLTNFLNEDTLYQSESTQVVVSASKDNLGVVQTVSNSFTTHYGYEKKDIVGVNIEMLMSSFYKDTHRFYMLRYFNSGNSVILDSTRKVFVRTKKGHIKPTLLHVKQNPFLENGLGFIGILRPIQESGDFILIRANGDIDGATDRISHVLNIEHDVIMSIFDFSKHMKPLIAIFNKKLFNYVKKSFVSRAFSIHDNKKKKPIPPPVSTNEARNLHPAELVSEQREQENAPLKETVIYSDRKKSIVKSQVDTAVEPSSTRQGILTKPSARTGSILGAPNFKKNSYAPEAELHSFRKREHRSTIITDQYMPKIEDRDQDHIYKIFSEMGAEFSFIANDEKRSRVTCILRVEPDIHEDTWTYVLRIDSIHTNQPLDEVREDNQSGSYDQRDERSMLFNRNLDFNAIGILEGLQSMTSSMHEPPAIPFSFGERKQNSNYGHFESMKSRGSDTNRMIQFNKTKTLASNYPDSSARKERKLSIFQEESKQKANEKVVDTLGNNFPTINEKSDARKAKIYAFMPGYSEDDSYSQTIEQDPNMEEDTMNPRGEIDRNYRKNESKYYAVEIDPEYELSELHEPSSSKKEKTKQIVTKDLMHKFKANFETSSIASSRGTKNRTDKIVEECVDQVYVHKVFNQFTAFFIITIIILESLIISQASYASNSYSQIKNKGDIVITAYIRADNMDLTNFAARLINVAIQNLFGDQTEEIYPQTIGLLQTYGKAMIDKNIELEKAIGGIEVELQAEFFSSGVIMYDFNETGPSGTYQKMNTFSAIDKIYATTLKILSDTNVTIPSRNYLLDYLVYNSLDTLALECETAVELTSSLMSKTISDFLSQMQLLTGASLAILIICVLVTIAIIGKMNRNAKRFWNYFMSISVEDVDSNMKFINKFLNAITKDIQYQQDSNAEIPKRVKLIKADKSAKNFSLLQDNKQISFTWFFASNAWLVLKLWPVLILLGATTIVNFKNSSTGVNKMKQMQAQIINVVYYMYMTDIGFISLIDIVLHNGTTYTRGKPVLEEVKRITSYGGDNQQYVLPFRNEDGTYADYQYNLIFGTSCNDSSILPPEYWELCYQLSGGTGMMGLLGTNPIYEKTMQEFANSWMQSPMSPELIPEFMQRYWNYVFMVNNFQNYYIMALQSVTNTAFFNFIATEKQNFITLVAVCSVIAAMITYLSLRVLLSRIREKDFRLKCFVKLVNVKLILKNRWLKNYLVENTDKLGDNLKKL